MTRSEAERLADILEACDELAAFVALGRARYGADRAVALAVERLLEIVGEAANALQESTRDRFPDVPWRDITRLRIVLAHHYHRVDADQVWSIATDDVAALAAALRAGMG